MKSGQWRNRIVLRQQKRIRIAGCVQTASNPVFFNERRLARVRTNPARNADVYSTSSGLSAAVFGDTNCAAAVGKETVKAEGEGDSKYR